MPKKGKEEKHQDELQDVQNFDDQETHQNNVCLEGLRRRWKRIRKVSAFLGVNLLSRDGLARRVYGCPLKAISESTDLRIRTFLSNKISLVCAFLILL